MSASPFLSVLQYWEVVQAFAAFLYTDSGGLYSLARPSALSAQHLRPGDFISSPEAGVGVGQHCSAT